MVAGMQHVLIEYVTNARDTIRDYIAIIQTLQHQQVQYFSNIWILKSGPLYHNHSLIIC